VVVKGTTVRINISQGPKPVTVPPEVGHLYDQAASELQAAGFSVAREDVDSNEPKDTVLSMNPAANSQAPLGSKVTLTVSKGPTTSAVPDVQSQDQATAVSILRTSGFAPVIQTQDVNDPTQNRIVLTQSPKPGTQAKPQSPVTITVGHYVAPPPPTTTAAPPPPTTTATTPTDTTSTDTTTTPTDTTPTDTTPTTTAAQGPPQ
jgi:serine/threonine-protein kinase